MIKIILIIILILFTGSLILDKRNFKIIFNKLYANPLNNPKIQQGNIMIVSNFDSSALINNHLKAIQNEKNMPVYFIKNDSIEELGYNSIKRLNPSSDSGKPILIKPNLGGFVNIKAGEDNGVYGRTTNPLFIKGIIKYLKEQNIKDIAIGESWGVMDANRVQKLFEITGYKKMADEMKIKIIDLNYYNNGDTVTVPVKINYPNAELLKNDVYIPKIYLKYLTDGIIINVPKMKTHQFAITSLSLKNLMGVLFMHGPSKYMQANKHLMHKEINLWFLNKNISSEETIKRYSDSYTLFSKRLLDLYVIAKPHFTIIEGFQGTEGDGFDKIKPREEHLSITSYNQVYADYAASDYMGFINSEDLNNRFKFNTPIYLTESLKRFYPNIKKIEDIQLIKEKNIKKDKPFYLIPMISK